MTDVGTITLNVSTQEVDDAIAKLDRLAEAAERAHAAIRKLTGEDEPCGCGGIPTFSLDDPFTPLCKRQGSKRRERSECGY